MTVNEYLKLPYHIIMHHDNLDEMFYTSVQELDDCYSQGKSPSQAYLNTLIAMESWIETALERGLEIPLPKEE